MSSRSRKGPQCSDPTCGSRRFEVGNDGYTYCSNGHQQSDLGTVVAEDTGELVVQGQTSRRQRSDAESIISKVSSFQGPKAFEHYLVCLQLVLRKQVQWLKSEKHLPSEFEVLVKDLWALRLQRLQGKVSYDADTDTEARSSQKFSSQSEGESGTDARSRNSQPASRKLADGPNMTDLLCINYISMLLLRIPVTVVDFHDWITSGQLLFYQASKEVPLAMRDRLPGTYQANLEPQELLAPQALHRRILIVARQLKDQFGMDLPPINHRLILHRWMSELALPIEIYAATQRLGRLLHMDYNYLSDRGHRTRSMRYPELRLATLMVVVTKLLFPFDQLERYSKSGSDLDAMKIDWQLWTEAHAVTTQKAQPTTGMSFQASFNMTEADGLNLGDRDLDDYLDWCEKNLASNDIRERGPAAATATFRRALFDMFPLHSPNDRTEQPDQVEPSDANADSTAATLRQVQSALRPRPTVTSADGNEPYLERSSHHHKEEAELVGPLRIFYERTASMVGYSLPHFTKAVFQMEKIVEKENAKLSSAEGGRGIRPK